jgi:hypothetical protein
MLLQMRRPAAYLTVHRFSNVSPQGAASLVPGVMRCDPTRTQSVCAGLGVPVTPNVSTGNGLDFLAGRVSYTFGLTGGAQRLPWPGTAKWAEPVK